ncbi:hypothetical protein K438DRAFT_1988293 [Mycena galopus ATCC 62051]|nr:hypothetical protein K438DRAFT_1988293 [Mycena galopus ATCC 62051]
MVGWNPRRSLYVAVTVLQTLTDSTANPQKARSHRTTANRVDNSTFHLDKRAPFVNQKFAWFASGLNACGSLTQDSDFSVAMSTDQFGGGSSCGKQITIAANESTATATCVDVCAGCSNAELDFTKGLFEYFTGGNLDVTLIAFRRNAARTAVIAGSVSVSVGLLAAVVILFLCVRRRRQQIAQRMLPEQFTNTEEHVSQDDLRLKTGSLLTQPVPVVAENDVLPHTNAEDGEGTVSLRLRLVEAQMETLLTMGFPEGSPPSYAG